MRRFGGALVAAFLLLAARLPAEPCPARGDAVRSDVQTLNVLKNRTAAVTAADIDASVTLGALLAPGNDARRWTSARGARVIGYVRGVRPGGVESVNCHARSVAERDTHIELTVRATDAFDERRMVVVEVTPRTRAQAARRGEDWSTAGLRRDLLGRTVEVTGWLMADTEHAAESANTASRSARHVWRGTMWELHPVTAIRVVAGNHPSG
ncbi:MAG: hypothetical protein H3C62_00995 [Gemmatimonadaceae bacterium]|nr:hypothetical protein [Gemmatimonadaceae bacterium]